MNRYRNLVANLADWPLHFGIKFGLVRRDPVRFRARNGVVVEVPRRLYHEFKEIYLEEAYTIGQQQPLTAARPVVVDIGANVGFFATFALARWPGAAVYAYEPVANNFRQLARNREANPGRTLVCHNQAVAGEAGTVTMVMAEAADDFTTTAAIGESNGEGHRLTVEAVTLADVLNDNQLERIDFLKLDCEGAEFAILEATPDQVLQHIDQMAMELHCDRHRHPQRVPDLIRRLQACGYTTFQLPDKPHMLWAHRQ